MSTPDRSGTGAQPGRTAWARSLAAPVRDFIATETGSAVVLVAAAGAALIWANVAASSYGETFATHLSVQLGGEGVSLDLRSWINEGLMTFFFLVVGLEAKRELDVGDLRERRRVAIPMLAAIGGIVVPVAIYLAFNGGRSGAHGWGAAMSTDTALALGAVALITPRSATRLRVFLITFAVFDDLAALIVIATVYTTHVSFVALLVALALFLALLPVRYLPFVVRRPVFWTVALALWVALLESGIDPVIAGLAVGLVTSAYPASREDLERVTELTRSFREQPTPDLARSAQLGVLSAVSPNERLQHRLHPWSSYLIVPLFALANTGVRLNGSVLSAAISSPISLGIFFGYVIGKPAGVLAAAWVGSRPWLRGTRPTISWPVLSTAGALAGIGFTVSLLVSSRAFTGRTLDEAKLGVLAAAIIAPAIGWLLVQVMRRLPDSTRARQIAGTAGDLLDLAEDVVSERDHIRGPEDALVTLVEYGDFECPYCGRAESTIRELLSGDADLRYVWRHLPLNDVHNHAQIAAEASEAAAEQGRFWDYYDSLFEHQERLAGNDLVRRARELDLDVDRFTVALKSHLYADRVGEDVVSADESGVTGTPSFFINGRRHQGAYDLDSLSAAVRAARTRAGLLASVAG